MSDKSTKVHKANVFESVETEYPKPKKTTVRGKVPQWLKGNLLRNGPGKFEFGKDTFNHLFDGSALLHRFNIQDGCITYQSKFLQSDAYLLNKANNRIVMSEFGTVAHPDPCKNIFKKFFSYFTPPDITDNCCVNWFQIGEDFFVCSETNLLRKVDPETLETKEKVDFTNYMAINTATAHPHQVGNSTYNIGNAFGPRTYYSIVKIDEPATKGEDPMKNSKIITSIPAQSRAAPSYYHSFSITQNYIIFIEQPLCMNLFQVLTAKLRNSAIVKCLDYYPEEVARFHVIERDSGRILNTQYTSDAFFNFHSINAYEEKGHIVVDLCCYSNANVLEESYLARLRDRTLDIDYSGSEVRRFVLPLIASEADLWNDGNLVTLDYTTASASLSDNGNVHLVWESVFPDAPGLELPQINYKKYNGEKYRYAYGIIQGTFEVGTKTNDALLTFEINSLSFCSEFSHFYLPWRNWISKRKHKLFGEEYYMGSEPVFVPAPNPTSEDDGVVLACMLSIRQDYWPYLIILDGKTFEEIARAEVPAYIPFGLHHMFVKAKDNGSSLAKEG
ncbi:carotenoid-cleaving dioxygenase, mitochondrial-like [Glandiceps talaboti]